MKSRLRPHDNRQKWHAFWIVFLGFMILHQAHGIEKFYYDADYYWQLSEFSKLVDFPKTSRGYLFSFLLSPARALADHMGDWGVLAFRLFSSSIYAFALTWPIADSICGLFGGKSSLTRRLIIPVFIAIVFPGLLLYPLTDLPAFLMLFAGVTLVARVGRSEPVWPLFWSGFLVAACSNIRSIYLVSVVLVALSVPYVLRARPWRERSQGFVFFLAGALLVAAPQMLINIRTHHTASPLVVADDTRTGKSLAAAQLQWGLTLQRYETSVRKQAPAPTFYYLDRRGEAIFATEKLAAKPLTVASYPKLVAQLPFDFLGIYSRHLVNGLDVRDGMIYTTVDSSSRDVFSIFNFCILFFGVLVAVASFRPTPEKMWWGAVLLAPVAAIVPGAIETRFFLPLHFLIYGMIANYFDWQELKAVVAKRYLIIGLAFVFSLITFSAMTSSTISSLSYSWPAEYR